MLRQSNSHSFYDNFCLCKMPVFDGIFDPIMSVQAWFYWSWSVKERKESHRDLIKGELEFNSQYSPIFTSDESISLFYLCPYPILYYYYHTLKKHQYHILHFDSPSRALYSLPCAKKMIFAIFPFEPIYFPFFLFFPAFGIKIMITYDRKYFFLPFLPIMIISFCFVLQPEYLGHHDNYLLKKTVKSDYLESVGEIYTLNR